MGKTERQVEAQERKVLLQGGGGHGKVVVDCLLSEGRQVVAVFDTKHSGDLLGVPRVRAYDPTVHAEAGLIIAIGDNAIRKKISSTVQHRFTNAVHPSSVISPFASIGTGCMILHRAVIQADCHIGNHVIINTGAQVDHDSEVGDFVHIAPRATLCGNVRVGEGTLVGAGAVVLPGVKIGSWVVVGAGAVVTTDISDGAVVAGVPARILHRQKN